MDSYSEVVTNQAGQAIQGASVLVQDSTGATATIFSDDGVTPASNPLTTDVNGRFIFFAASGRYTLVITATGFPSKTLKNIVLFDPSEAGEVAFSPAGNIVATNAQDAIEELDDEKTSVSSLAASGGAGLVGVDTGTFSGTLDDYLAVTTRFVSNLTALKALSAQGANSRTVYLLGRTSAGDGGQGVFRWDSSDLSTEVTADTQNGVYVPPNSDTTGASGAWVRQVIDRYNALWFGAVGDGATDDSTALQAAIDFVASVGGALFIPAGEYLLSSSLNLKSGIEIEGVFPKAVSDHARTWDLEFHVTGGTFFTFPGGTVFTSEQSANTGTSETLVGVHLKNLGFEDVGSFLTIGAQNAQCMAGSVIENIIGGTCTGVAMDLINPLHVQVSYFKGGDVKQLLRVTSDNDDTLDGWSQPGNSYFEDLYAHVSSGGMDQATIHLRALENSGNGTNLNYVTLGGRIQVNHFGNAAEGYHILAEGGATTRVFHANMKALDLEGQSLHHVKLNNANHCTIEYMGDPDSSVAVHIDVEDGRFNVIQSNDDNTVVNFATSAAANYLHGVIKEFAAGSQFVVGNWYAKTANAAQLGLTSIRTLSAAHFGDQNAVSPNNPLYLDFTPAGGGVQRRIREAGGATVTVLKQDGTILASSANNQTVTLPDAEDCEGLDYVIKKTGATGTVTVDTTGSQTIDGAASVSLSTQFEWVRVQSDGSNWHVIGQD